VVAAVWWWLGHRTQALVLVGVAAVLAVLVAAGLPVQRWLGRFVDLVVRAVSAVLSVGVGVLLVVGGWASRLVGVDPLRGRRRRYTGWQPATPAATSRELASATYGVDRPDLNADVRLRPAWRVVLGAVPRAVGVVVLLLTANLLVGLGVDRFQESAPAALTDVINVTGAAPVVDDPRADHPSMADSPWAEEYFRDVQRTPFSYWPFVESRPLTYSSEYVNIDGWDRRTFRPPGVADGQAPVLWMFGGSTTWGEGQRDDFTIASHLARIADREGVPLLVRNYGQRGWTHFQEMILFEQLLAEGPPPDLAVFYDGANEINAQSLSVKGVPTHTLVDQYAEALLGNAVAEEVRAPAPTRNAAQQAWDAYVRVSAVHQLVRSVQTYLDPPAGATTTPDRAVGRDADGDGARGTTSYSKTIDDARNAVEVYERGRDLTLHLARTYDVRPFLYWQPVVQGPTEVWAARNVGPPTIDISDALDGNRHVYIDGGHTNEEGARIVAERIWADLEPAVRRWYEQRQ
jgi:hypothetical protein